MNHKIFVYGTLRKEGRLHSILTRLNAVFVGNGETKERYDMTANGCPFVNPNIHTSNIIGEVYEVEDEGLRFLDGVERYTGDKETSWYFRELIPIILTSGEEVEANIYFNEKTIASDHIPSGDFIEYDKIREMVWRAKIQAENDAKEIFADIPDETKTFGDKVKDFFSLLYRRCINQR